MGTLVIEGSAPGSLFQNSVPDVSRLVVKIGHDAPGSTGINDGVGSFDAVASVSGWLVGNAGARALGLKLVRVDTLRPKPSLVRLLGWISLLARRSSLLLGRPQTAERWVQKLHLDPRAL